MEGLWVACLYSSNCSALLKEKKFQKNILDFIKHPKEKDVALVKKILEQLDPFIFYLLIATQNEIFDPFAEEVVRAYWLGNDFLRTITPIDIRRFLALDFISHHNKIKLLRFLDLIDEKPHHNWQTICLIKKNIKREQKISEELLASLDNCLVKAGEVIWVGKKIVRVKTKKLSLKANEIVLEDNIATIERGVYKIKEGDLVSVHLSQTKEKINEATFYNLLRITQEAISF